MINVIVRDAGAVVVRKEVYEGDDDASRILIANQHTRHPSWTYEEVDEETFNATEMGS